MAKYGLHNYFVPIGDEVTAIATFGPEISRYAFLPFVLCCAVFSFFFFCRKQFDYRPIRSPVGLRYDQGSCTNGGPSADEKTRDR